MSRLREAWRRVRLAALATPGLRVILLAIRNYVMHQSANQAGSLAFSSVLAIFPLLILLSASAGFVGQPGDAAALARRVMGYAPQVVRDAMQPVIEQVLAQRSQALLTIGVLTTLWAASSGMQAIRSALNRAYGIERGLPFWKARIKVTLFTVIAGTGVLAAFSSVVVMPYVWQLLKANAGVGQDTLWLHNSVRYGSAFLVLMVLYALLYGWLPDIRQRLYTVMPGALVGAALWVAAAATLSYTFRTAGKLALLYGSFAGVVATLVFLYISATTLIFGAEINGVLRQTAAPPEQAPLGWKQARLVVRSRVPCQLFAPRRSAYPEDRVEPDATDAYVRRLPTKWAASSLQCFAHPARIHPEGFLHGLSL
jgi:membrane protein